ncbi:DUF3310 domain-containing protein [Streptomyces sp. CS7]|uniref:DUF3310 domain-containing protein n=1 Tax=Streptomyces sp. CS-7 TaxID=2906769 RepID=UPI0021B4259D|nr:DUF3310 domain-containing protein [Streptomyces sp. CS-7]MCT6776124.1 DUF3310 domain-containing protein [Streptomyces sp. CS-7]
MTYQIGDEVVIASPATSLVQQYKGETGTITDVAEGGPYNYEVRLKYRKIAFAASELAHVTPEDEVNHPAHYTWLPHGVEVIDITELLNFNVGNVVKYALRAGHKTEDPITDLRKAAWYINREIERLEAK